MSKEGMILINFSTLDEIINRYETLILFGIAKLEESDIKMYEKLKGYLLDQNN